MSKVCGQCGAVRPKGRTRYCSDQCAAVGAVNREIAKKQSRLAACLRCQGPKELGTRGAKYCEACRAIISDTTAQMEYERGRRRQIVKLGARVAAGERVPRRKDGGPEGTKWCARCQDFRPLESFPRRSKADAKAAAYCIPCQRSYNRERRLQMQYGMTYDEYELLFACQDGRCAICGGRPRKHALSVDHDHKTGEIRGLLCSRCNHKLLGSANDDPARLRKAADYLESFGPRDVFGEKKFIPGTGGAA